MLYMMYAKVQIQYTVPSHDDGHMSSLNSLHACNKGIQLMS